MLRPLLGWKGYALAGAAVLATGVLIGTKGQYHLRQRPAVAALTLDLAGLREARAAELLARDVEILAWQSSNRFLSRAIAERDARAAALIREFEEDIRNDPLPELARPVDPSRALRLCRFQAAAQGRPDTDCAALAGERAAP